MNMNFNPYNLYCALATEQYSFQEEYNLINELENLYKVTKYEDLDNFISKYSKEDVFKEEFSCQGNIQILIEKTIERNAQTIHIEAKQSNKQIFNNYWTRLLG